MLDNAAVVAIGAFALLGVAYFTYGRFLGRKVFRLDPNHRTPAHTLEDGVDFVPTRIPVLFGHHFASIAGLGPILGPAIAVIWGWVPAVLWVVFGCIFIGAVHDLGALTVSLRFQGRTIGDVCRDLMGPRARLLALLIIFFLMSLAMGAFVLAISGLFVNYNPDAIIPSFGLMVVAMIVGVSVYKLKVGLGPATVLGLAAFAGLILWGVAQPVTTYEWFVDSDTQAALATARDAESAEGAAVLETPYGAAAAVKHFQAAGEDGTVENLDSAVSQCKNTWIVVLLGYAFIASVLPVWLLLQPRDYINSFQLYFALATLLVGLTVAAATGAAEGCIDAPAFRPVVPEVPLQEGQMLEDVPHAPSWFPLLFVTIACGAVSGFHAMVSSGTTVRQINRETDAVPIGYGSMLVEGGLAILVILACTAGLGAAAWQSGGEYASWGTIKGAGLPVQLSAVVRGGANFLNHLGIPVKYGSALLAVTIVAFAMTTLDTATRLLRFNVEEICRSLKLNLLANRYFASLTAVAGIAFFAFVLTSGGKTLWILFGTTNQLLAGLTLLTVSVFLFKLGRPIVYTLVPMVLMFGVSIYAMAGQLEGFVKDGQWAMVTVCAIILGIAGWLIVEAIISFARGRGGLDFGEPTVDGEANSQ
ncbi:MAG: carbon starvation protein A [Candidatus Nealsonbacteria bacterium]|nr:carbon starvation protein A [Candidatus Nealsonbacteria bacterium]